MDGLERDFRCEFQIPSSDWRNSYKIFFSRVHVRPVLFLGTNPAGDPSGGNLDASSSYYEGWEHDFVKYRGYGAQYRLAGPAYDTLAACLGTNSADEICKVPMSNVCFWRSVKPLNERVRFRQHVAYVKRLVERVRPELIILCGAGE